MKPVWMDLETTGTNVDTDRIVEIALIDADTGEVFESLVNPAMAIPKEASDVHGKTWEMVKDAPLFMAIASRVHALLKGRDLAGYNVRAFDRPLLEAELARCGFASPWAEDSLVYDVLEMVRKVDPQTLENVARRYLTTLPEGRAHTARYDVQVCQEVLGALIKRHAEMPRGGESLAMWAAPDDIRLAVDATGKLIRNELGDVVMNFGDHKGKTLTDLASTSDGAGFLKWMLGKDFTDRVKREVRKALGIAEPWQGTLL